MNFKDYSLKEHLNFTIDALYKEADTLRIDVEPQGNPVLVDKVHHYKKTQNYGTPDKTSIIEYGNGSMEVRYEDDQYSFLRKYGTTELNLKNMFVSENTLRKIIIKKQNDFYHMFRTNNTINAQKLKDNKRFYIEYSPVYKEYLMSNMNTTYKEQYTTSSKTLVRSFLLHDHVYIKMEKKVSHTIGNLVIHVPYFMNEKIIINFEGEPCLLRLLNKSFIFVHLMNTELALVINKVQEAIIDCVQKLKQVPCHNKNLDEILEYYTKNGD